MTARLVTFCDPMEHNFSIKNADGSLWIDKEKHSWLDPSDEQSHNYLIDVAKETAKLGVDEIELDFVRYSAYTSKSEKAMKGRFDAINSFLKNVVSEMHKLGISVAADVFGCVIDGATLAPTDESSQILEQTIYKCLISSIMSAQ